MQSLLYLLRSSDSPTQPDVAQPPPAPIPYTDYSVPQRLPPELIEAIFKALLADVYPHAFAFTLTQPGFYAPASPLDAGGAQRGAAGALLSCRAWNIAGTPFLYVRPLLASLPAIGAFERTLSMHPALAQLVEHVMITDHAIRELLSWNALERATQATAGAASILAICPAFHTLSLSMRPVPSIACVPKLTATFIAAAQLSRLRRLTICGFHCPLSHVIGPEPALPELEELCLRDMLMVGQETLQFLALPRLHTLQLARIETWSVHLVLPPPAALPALRTVGLYQNALGPSFEHGLYAFLPQLERLHFVSTYIDDERFMEQVNHSDTLVHLQHFALTMGDAPFDGHWIQRMRISSALVSLTVLIPIVPATWGEREMSALDSLLMLIRRNGAAITTSGSLRELIVEVESERWGNIMDDRVVKANFDYLRTVCETYGVHLQVNQDGMCRHRFRFNWNEYDKYIAGHWITKQLTGTRARKDFW